MDDDLKLVERLQGFREDLPEADDIITDAIDTITRLVKERDEALADTDTRWFIRMADIREASGIGVKPMLSEVPDALAALRTRAETAEAQRDAALAALRPFAGAAARYDENDTCDRVPDDEPVGDWYGVDLTVTAGHFRAASRAIGGGE